MQKRTYLTLQNFNAVFTLAVLFASFYLQYVSGLIPCPLCIMQRLCVFLLLAVMGLSFRTIKKAHIISILQMLLACAGLFFSLRQLWIQSLPAAEVPACMPGLDVLIRYFPWQTVLKTLFWGAGDCAEVSWSFLGLSMPGWSALYFIIIFFLSSFLFRHTWNSK